MRDIAGKNGAKTETKYGVYVHIPFCRSRCAYCGFISCTKKELISHYVDALTAEIKERVGGKYVDTVYLGGGTPSVLPVGEFKRILDAVYNCAHIEKNCEITTEANPDSFTDEFAFAAADCGVNRISLGVQSLCDRALKAVGRRHDAASAVKAVKRAVKKFCSISCDLIIGLPESSCDDVLNSVRVLCGEGVKHISAYALSVEEGTPLYRSAYRPNEDESALTYERAALLLNGLGLPRYEISNFASLGYECRHNLKYWTLLPYIGVGVAAHSFYGGERGCNTDDLSLYISGERGYTSTAQTAADALEEYIMLSLRTEYGAEWNRLNELVGGDWKKSKQRELSFLQSGGFIQNTPNGFKLTDKAFYVSSDITVKLL